jgi:thymidine kinase
MSSFFNGTNSKLVLIIGPMFSGKTSTLISEMTRYVDVDIPVLYINSSEDTRGEKFSTHNSSLSLISEKINTTKTKTLETIPDELLNQSSVIAIDEAQFFPDLVSFVKKWLRNKKIIYVGGLDGDIQQKLFGEIVYLIPYATEVRKLNAVCEKCRKKGYIHPAPFTIRHNTNQTDKKIIGGKDIYIPVCSDCLFESPTERSKPEQSKPEQYEPRDLIKALNYII